MVLKIQDEYASLAVAVAGYCGTFSPIGTCNTQATTLKGDDAIITTASGWMKTLGKRRYCTAKIAVPDGVHAAIKGRPFSLASSKVRLQLAWPHTSLAVLDGRFGLAAITDQRLLLATDILGAGALFYCFGTNGAIYFASHLGLLLNILPRNPEIDRLGTAAVLAGSCQIGGRTHFKGVRRLGAASFLRLDHGTPVDDVSEQTYLDIEETLCPKHTESVPEISALHQAFTKSLRRESISSQDVLLLSGGLDSKAIAATLAGLGGEKPTSYTYGEWHSRDVREARLLAKLLGYQHSRLDYSRWKFSDFASGIVSLTGGMAGLQTAHNTVGIARLPYRVRAAITGFLGDALTGKHLDEGSDQGILFPFKEKYGRQFRDCYGTELLELPNEIERSYQFPNTTSRQASMLRDLLVRQASWISTTHDLWDWILPIKTPFFSRHLIQYFLCLPDSSLRDQALYRQWIQALLEDQRSNRITTRIRYGFRRTADDLIDRVRWRTGHLRKVNLVDWPTRISRESNYLRSIALDTPSKELGAILIDELDAGRLYPHVLLTGANALAARRWQPGRTNKIRSGPTSGTI